MYFDASWNICLTTFFLKVRYYSEVTRNLAAELLLSGLKKLGWGTGDYGLEKDIPSRVNTRERTWHGAIYALAPKSP